MPRRTLITFKPIRVPLARAVRDKDFYDAMVKEVESFAEDLRKDFEATTVHWTKKPKFHIKSSLLGNKVTFKVYTTSLIYYMLSKGIRRHRIEVQRVKALKFAVAAKFVVGGTRSAFAKFVRHPGVRKRDYPAKIMRERKPTFSPRMHAAINKAIMKKRVR